jgi:hypothetical protein
LSVYLGFFSFLELEVKQYLSARLGIFAINNTENTGDSLIMLFTEAD